MRDFSKSFSYEGTECVVLENGLGFLCGYASVGTDSPLYGVSYDKVRFEHDVVHGGLTFSGTMDGSDGLWWFGFDCEHAWDAPWDVERYDSCVSQVAWSEQMRAFDMRGKVWTPEMVEAETMLLAYLLDTATVESDGEDGA